MNHEIQGTLHWPCVFSYLVSSLRQNSKHRRFETITCSKAFIVLIAGDGQNRSSNERKLRDLIKAMLQKRITNLM